MLGQADEAAGTGRVAVASFARVNDDAVTAEHPDPTAPRRGTGELLTAMADLAGFEFHLRGVRAVPGGDG